MLGYGPLQKLFLYRDTSQKKFVPDNIDAHAIKLLLEVLHADALRLMTTLDQAQNLHEEHNSTSAQHNSELMMTQSKRAQKMKKNSSSVYINMLFL